MSQPLLRFKAGRRKHLSRNRASQTSAPAIRNTALIQGSNQVQFNDGTFTVVGGDSHTHFHSYENGTTVTLESILRAIPNFRKIHQDTLSKATPGTGMWLLKSKKFSLWLEPNGDLKIFWGSGIPGAGKTILAALVIDMLEALARESGRRICVAYVYIRYNDQAKMTVRSILEILVKQMVERHPEFLPAVRQVYTPHIEDDTEPTESQLLLLLQELTQRVATTFVLDALDEAPTNIQLDLVAKLSAIDCKIFITSRPLRAVEAQFPSAHRFPIIAQDSDIDLLINQKLKSNADLQGLLGGLDSHAKDEIVMAIKSKCGGMFLHASLQLDAICQCLSVYDVKETLDAFPSDIEDAYLQTWNRILNQNTRHVSLAKAILLWVLNAQRSMTIEELQCAVATPPDTFAFDSSRMVPEATLLSICRGLVMFEEESRLVRLVHYTARQPLESLLHESFPHPHSLIAAVCMTRLTDCGFQNTTLDSEEALQQALDGDPLLTYSHDAWAFHARLSLDVKATAAQLTKFVTDCHTFPALIYRSFDVLTPLHLVAFYKLPLALAGSCNDGDINIQTREGGYTPMALACLQGDLAGLQAILSLPGVCVNTQDMDGWSALMCAGYDGYGNIVELLLNHPEIDVNVIDEDRKSALVVAAIRGHDHIIELLLAHRDVHVNLIDTDGMTALMRAASKDRELAVKLLLAHPKVDTNVVEKEGWSALMYAAIGGYESIVELLLAHPETKVNSGDKDGWSALRAAAGQGHDSIVKLFLAHPETKVNLADIIGWSALMAAASDGHEGTVRILLTQPEISVNLADEDGNSALINAAAEGYQGIVELLLAHTETQVNLVNKGRQSALMRAAENGCKGVVEVILSHSEIEVNQVDIDGDSALMISSINGQESIVELLLLRPEIDVNLMNQDGLSALMQAACNGFEGIVSLLLSHSDIRVNLLDGDGWSALNYASLKGLEGIANLLLGHPDTDINAAGPHGTTALLTAAQWGHAGVAKLLLAVPGIDVNSVDGDGDTAVKMAAEAGHEDVVQILLDVAGIDVAVVSRANGHTAMSAAMANGHNSIVQLLEAFEARNGRPTLRSSMVTEIGESSTRRGQTSEDLGEGSDSDEDEAFEDALDTFQSQF